MSCEYDKSLTLDDGGSVVLVDMLDTDKASVERIHRNVYRIDETGKVAWQVGDYAPMSNSTFTNIYFDELGVLIGYNFDGIEYLINMDTGELRPKRLVK